jgi:dTDP-4-amino-4,6-dideoxygalactose transaminase
VDSTPLALSLPSIDEAEERAVLRVLRSGWLSTGAEAEAFEHELAAMLGVEAVVAVNSCTAALHLSVLAAGVQPGDEVVTTAITWPAAANVIVHAGATPVFADVESATLNIDPSAAAAAVTARTAALMPVHIAGQPVRLDEIALLAETHRIPVIEDAAHALGAVYRGRRIGSLSPFTCFSFYPTKAVTTGEGGAIALRDAATASHVRLLSRHGMSANTWTARDETARPTCVAPGFKYNLPDLLAAMGRVQLVKLERFLAKRRTLVAMYREALTDLPAIRLLKQLPEVESAHHLFPIIVRPELSALNRDELASGLLERGIQTGVHYRALHLQPYYAERFGLRPEDLPEATKVSRTVLSLPLHPGMSTDDVIRVADQVRRLVTGR